MGNALAAVPNQDLTGANLYVAVDGQEKAVQDLHPDDKAYARLDPKVILRQHPDAYFRLRVKLDDIWQPPAAEARTSLEGFLGQRLPELSPSSKGSPAKPDSQKLTTWGWVTAIGSVGNAVALIFFPMADGSSLASLRAMGGQPTAMTRLVANSWFSPVLGVLTAACLVQAFLAPTRRKFWIGVSYLPMLIALAATALGAYSVVSSMLGNIK
jgi:hypothetical protein